ncbi:MAG TPA: ethanolamine ammonia-lyase subunit EutC [Tepidisphaeraceae bacterium]|jgi:ethanolamine ammonia-lyase small subunit|nr:ethanolamine ammonia-lyase subunit EutC [Tepidisphaeraceae bacterium]
MTPDSWSQLRAHTSARIALGRAGGSLPTAELLAFAADHADARDAVYAALQVGPLIDSLAPLNLPILSLRSRATNRETYLKRPDLGRRLDAGGAAVVASNATAGVDVALIVGDGLSAVAAQRHAAAVLIDLASLLRERHFSLGPLCIVTQARVAVQDEIGSLLNARAAVILIGERPGLGAADSLGGYLVYNPTIGNTDARRNCISNIRPGGLNPAAAAHALAWLLEQSLVRKISGVGLKDDRDPSLKDGDTPTARI